jgi:hypothetical protein
MPRAASQRIPPPCCSRCARSEHGKLHSKQMSRRWLFVMDPDQFPGVELEGARVAKKDHRTESRERGCGGEGYGGPSESCRLPLFTINGVSNGNGE